ncbi:MAG TPA: transposase [Candidatus Acidoferrales bacterium]|nr:transposase [Candidatus Acidoferrales bacterium]
MAFDPERHHRQSIRLRGYDYRSPSAYFVTAVTVNRECLFADLSLCSIVERCWLAIPRHSAHAALDAWVVMPNHIHGIVVIDRRPDRGDTSPASSGHVRVGSLGTIIGSFKSLTTRRINRARRTPAAPVWQRNYYEHIVRNNEELNRIRAYIAANPMRWDLDRENPERGSGRDEWNADEDRWFTPSRPMSSSAHRFS